MQTIKEKMIPAFREANGGLFQAVEKADVGSAYQDLEKRGEVYYDAKTGTYYIVPNAAGN